jgi:uncharacterized membrane protein
MVSAYASASSTATPRSFTVVIADDVSQNALSAFIGAFIFSVVALAAVKNSYFETDGRFVLFIVTLVVFAIVIIAFVTWVDEIARLGRMGTTIDKVEEVTKKALLKRQKRPTLGAKKLKDRQNHSGAIFADTVGYVQRIDVSRLQEQAEKQGCEVTVTVLPGTFATPAKPLAYIHSANKSFGTEMEVRNFSKAFLIGGERRFDDDPRFGLVVLSEIASRALSPAVNDPGTAIDIIGTLVRLFTLWNDKSDDDENSDVEFDRVFVPELAINDMFDDAFNGIARDGASLIEVDIRLQKAFASLASLGDEPMKEISKAHAQLAYSHAKRSLELPEEVAKLRKIIPN